MTVDKFIERIKELQEEENERVKRLNEKFNEEFVSLKLNELDIFVNIDGEGYCVAVEDIDIDCFNEAIVFNLVKEDEDEE